MALADRVHVARRFQRAVRIDLDFRVPEALDGFVCPPSSAEVLKTMARHVSEGGQGAFTWTGPYGSGKSSLAVALGALLNGNSALRQSAEMALGEETASVVWDALPPRSKGWLVLPVVGRRERPAQVVGQAMEACGFTKGLPVSWSDMQVLDALSRVASQHPRAGGGLMVIIDEMGKFLESAAYDSSDIYFFQQLAEIASRSDNRLVVVGILHQAFDEYANRLSRESRDEWAKIQGRFVDLAVNAHGNEQIDLLSRAIVSDRRTEEPGPVARWVAALARAYTSPQLAQTLEECWPLHPIVACLLGPISRRRFGQNQRSLFGFLNSSEPQGFQDFLRSADDGDLYTPDLLWDYLRINLEPSIMASPDGHRWASAVDALERCQAMGGEERSLRLLKVVALIGMFRERSGLTASKELLQWALTDSTAQEIEDDLARLMEWSLVVYRKFDDSYSVFDGSDFDIENAVTKALESVTGVDFGRLEALAGLQPVVAKRHYHKTGAFRWFDVRIAPLVGVEEAARAYAPRNGAIGAFFLALPTQGESDDQARATSRRAVDKAADWDVVVGLPQGPWDVAALARELVALEQVRDESPELQGDRVARREMEARVSYLQGRLEGELVKVFDSALWHRKGSEPEPLPRRWLNALASELADNRFPEAPRLLNELLNRGKPSSSAVAAQNVLLRRMALHEGEERLGIEGFSTEGGLFESLLEATRLYWETPDGWRFVSPDPIADDSCDGDPCNLAPAWGAALRFLQDNAHRSVSVAEVYDIWRNSPFGIKDGLLPVLGVAFILSMRANVVFYRQGVFQARMTDLDTDYLAKDPSDVRVRWMNLSDASRILLSNMADIVRGMDEEHDLAPMEPIDVARGLISIYDRLPPWVGRTQRLSANAKRLRQLFKQASDPNRLIFDAIPEALSDGPPNGEDQALRRITDNVRDGLNELRTAYSSLLHRLRETLLSELEAPNASAATLAELRSRADNVRELGGDHRLEAFIMRLAIFQGTDEDVESLASLATNKPIRQWVDADADMAAVELADMAQRFNRVEAYAHVKGRPDRRHAMAVVVSMSGRPETLHDYFEVTDLERQGVDDLVSRVEEVLENSGEERRNIVLAALAELGARYIGTNKAYTDRAATRKEQLS